MSLLKIHVLRSGRALVLGSLSLLASFVTMSANAATFGVKVVDDRGQPIAGAAVCIGLPGNYKQFGAKITDEGGVATVDVPNVPLVVTISKTRFSAMRVNEPARGFNLLKEMTLSEGNPGPRCNAGQTIADNLFIKIDSVEVTESAYSTTLTPSVDGDATQYRVSRTPSFTGAKWQRFQSSIALSASLSDEDEVYLQLRRYIGSSKSWVEASSAVVTVKLPAYQ
ncbi:MAG: hypothetical protein AB8B84_01870 [Granulosicoccus sp.]